MNLIPGSNQNIEERQFKWKITVFNNYKMTVDIFFDDPDYISTDESNPDVLMVTFYNTHILFAPQDQFLTPIKDGFSIKAVLPVQINRSAYQS